MIKVGFAALGALAFSIPAAAITIDGVVDAAYGGPTATVAYNPAAPNSNFGAPTNESAYTGYNIYLSTDYTNVYGVVQANPAGGGASVGTFANLYFDLDPANGNGSDIGFELSPSSQDAFVAGVNGSVTLNLQTAASADGLTFEFAIPVFYFTSAIAGLNYDPNQQFVSQANPDLVLRLSQTFGYSVAGGASYGADRLGRLSLFAPDDVPEPATLGLMGLGVMGLGLRRRKAQA